jgi:hypothetical protein
MFQYAMARSLAHKLGTELKLDLTHYRNTSFRAFELGVFRLRYEEAKTREIDLYPVYNIPFFRKVRRKLAAISQPRHYYIEHGLQYHPEVWSLSPDTYLKGYWHHEQYFAGIAGMLREEFGFGVPLRESNRRYIEAIASTNSISLHVRRGDYVNNKAVLALNGVCSPEYYREAVRTVAERVDSPQFFIFSDDPEWVRANLPLEYPSTIVEGNTGEYGYEDLHLMSRCRHQIIANSTFSWWGAWLNANPDKLVIAPGRWYADPESDRQVAGLLPTSWHRLALS